MVTDEKRLSTFEMNSRERSMRRMELQELQHNTKWHKVHKTGVPQGQGKIRGQKNM
jgi:hypothetical protein